MTAEADIFDALKGLVSNRVYPDVAPSGAALPYITYQQIGGSAITFLERVVPSKKNGRFQINCWAESRVTAAALALQIQSALVTATTMQAEPIGMPTALYEEDTNLRGARQDFSVWSTT